MFHQYFFEAPIDESHTRIFFVNMRSFMLEPENDGRLVKVNLTIAQEDIDILEIARSGRHAEQSLPRRCWYLPMAQSSVTGNICTNGLTKGGVSTWKRCARIA